MSAISGHQNQWSTRQRWRGVGPCVGVWEVIKGYALYILSTCVCPGSRPPLPTKRCLQLIPKLGYASEMWCSITRWRRDDRGRKVTKLWTEVREEGWGGKCVSSTSGQCTEEEGEGGGGEELVTKRSGLFSNIPVTFHWIFWNDSRLQFRWPAMDQCPLPNSEVDMKSM